MPPLRGWNLLTLPHGFAQNPVLQNHDTAEFPVTARRGAASVETTGRLLSWRYTLYAIRPVTDEGQEFCPRFLFVAEAAQHGRGNSSRMLLLHAAHHHTQVAGLNDHAHSLKTPSGKPAAEKASA